MQDTNSNISQSLKIFDSIILWLKQNMDKKVSEEEIEENVGEKFEETKTGLTENLLNAIQKVMDKDDQFTENIEEISLKLTNYEEELLKKYLTYYILWTKFGLQNSEVGEDDEDKEEGKAIEEGLSRLQKILDVLSKNNKN